MADSAHTPGPWVIGYDTPENTENHRRVRIGAEGRNDGVYVAHTLGRDCVPNARLIAAAPDLIEALNAVMTDTVNLTPNFCANLTQNTRRLIREALAKAVEPAIENKQPADID